MCSSWQRLVLLSLTTLVLTPFLGNKSIFSCVSLRGGYRDVGPRIMGGQFHWEWPLFLDMAVDVCSVTPWASSRNMNVLPTEKFLTMGQCIKKDTSDTSTSAIGTVPLPCVEKNCVPGR